MINGDFSSEVDEKWLESEKQLEKISDEMLEWAVSSRTLDPDTNLRWLNVATAHYTFWVAQHLTWSAIKANNQVANYVEIKRSTITKFISAVAERESSLAVAKERYMRNRAEANMLKAQQVINTCKQNQKVVLSEKSGSTYAD